MKSDIKTIIKSLQPEILEINSLITTISAIDGPFKSIALGHKKMIPPVEDLSSDAALASLVAHVTRQLELLTSIINFFEGNTDIDEMYLPVLERCIYLKDRLETKLDGNL